MDELNENTANASLQPGDLNGTNLSSLDNLTPKRTKKKKLLLVFVIILIIVLGVGGYIVYNILNTTVSIQQMPEQEEVQESTSTPVITEDTEQVYQNSQYNFQFTYPDVRYGSNGKRSEFEITEDNNTLVLIEHIYKPEVEVPTNEVRGTYTLYPVSAAVGADMEAWWRANIETDIGLQSVPGNYLVNDSTEPLFFECILESNPFWTSPPTLEITENEGTAANPSSYEGSIYMFYDFGVPFILHFVENSAGTCSTYPILATMSSLSN